MNREDSPMNALHKLLGQHPPDHRLVESIEGIMIDVQGAKIVETLGEM